MNVSLTPELERQVQERVATGRYTSASEVVREALRLWFDVDDARRRSLDEMNRQIAEGLAQLDRGEGVAGDEARQRSLGKIAARRRARPSK